MKTRTQIEPNTILRQGKNIPFSQLDDELLAIDTQANYCYSLNETAGRVWELIGTPVTLSAVCAQLGREYAVDEQTCRVEVAALVQKLSAAGLVRIDYAATH
ncbi:MAG TPA: PqqD family protein [Caldilineaceae bacterium]|nr:PqqD family protein [Caldilineaceae bacterium]